MKSMMRHGADHSLALQWKVGGRAAHAALEVFVLQRLHVFDKDRAKADRNSTSRLSPHVHYGEISVRHIFYVVRDLPCYYLSLPWLILDKLVSYVHQANAG